MKAPQNLVFRSLCVVFVGGLLALQFLPFAGRASAAQIIDRKLTLKAGATDGGSKPLGEVNHFFEFSIPTTGTAVGSIRFDYCTTAANSLANPTCVAPTGMDDTGVTLFDQSTSEVAGFTVVNTANDNSYYVTRTATAPGAGNESVKLEFDNITNPGPTKGTFFVRISTYSSTDTTGSPVDNGTVAASTAEPIVLDGTMPESLVFCTGETIGLTSGVPDCATATDGIISFNQLFSPTDTAIANSQMVASTNAGAGYAITVNGATMTSGSNTITGNATASASLKGVSQFGLNLRANSAAASASFPAASADVTAASNGTNFRGQPATGYDLSDTFTFNSNAVVANSYNGGPGGSDAQIFTASYIVNVPGSQPAGTYTTTLTYICTPTF